MAKHTYKPKVHGATVVSPRGQVVIPAAARKELQINSGDTLLVVGIPQENGLLLLKAEAIEDMLARMGEHMEFLQQLAEDYR